MNPANKENAPKAPEEEPEKIEFVSTENDREDKEEAEIQGLGVYCAFMLYYVSSMYVHPSIVKLFANAM
ncbi:hypothetical protein PVK06_027338 [Gossypium arboreum]|uniref:Uncharacterized protein n=1 Tax=Gossypium arboreum TaxID=29729 RepID=A0ABR0P004_GOSAR|nr:hypothetical protein PVK06_027338 [Gossypium arboreum]